MKHNKRLPKEIPDGITSPEEGEPHSVSESEAEMTSGNRSNQKRKQHYENKVHACLCNGDNGDIAVAGCWGIRSVEALFDGIRAVENAGRHVERDDGHRPGPGGHDRAKS